MVQISVGGRGFASSVTEHINMILARLTSVGIKFDDEVQALLLLLSLLDNWSRMVTLVTSLAGSDGFTFEKICDLILGEDVRRRSFGELSSESLYVIRGKRNIRDSGSKNKRKSQSKTRDCSSVTCGTARRWGISGINAQMINKSTLQETSRTRTF